MEYLPHFNELFIAAGLEYSFHKTEKTMDAYNMAKQFCREGSCGIIGIGGDGTFQEIAAGMVDAFAHGEKIPTPLGVFAAGSGNDFAISLAESKAAALNARKKHFDDAAKDFFAKILQGQTRSVDIITANSMAYLNIANLGLDARIVQNAANLKQKFGRYAYFAAVYKSITQHKNMPLEITIDGQSTQNAYTLVAICNGQYYGGGMRIAPTAQIDDGQITLCTVNALSRPKTMIIFPTLMLEKHTSLKAVTYTNCKKITIKLPPGQETLCLDGNLYPASGEIEFRLLPSVLDVFV
ncbi:MAG: hypothetical protein FWC78_02060 [Defluviitaleaceae bacterium]|nr:hypothetical protein [Defluviitaleaceae bacterium]